MNKVNTGMSNKVLARIAGRPWEYIRSGNFVYVVVQAKHRKPSERLMFEDPNYKGRKNMGLVACWMEY